MLFTRVVRQILKIGGASLLTTAPVNAAETQPTLLSGEFGDERLMIAADAESNSLSGYYRDGECRVFMKGKLQPVIQYQRADLGESYEVQSWDPRKPDTTFTTTLYSRARGGFNQQITLEPGPDDANRPVGCRWRVSLDRAAHVGNSLIGVAVIARPQPQLFELGESDKMLRLVPNGRAALPRDFGVWITKTYGAAWSPPGLVRITWYDPPGTPHGGYIRERDLYPASQAKDTGTQSLPCVTLRDCTFEPVGDCALPTAEGSYIVGAEALRQLDFDRRGLASMAIRTKGYAYVRRDGRALVVPSFDNAPDEFLGGLVRVRIGEKFGYANRRLKVVIPAIYDGAYPFASGRARVCIGCVSVSDGEHSAYQGGTTLCIDQRGSLRPDAECSNASWLPQLRE